MRVKMLILVLVLVALCSVTVLGIGVFNGWDSKTEILLNGTVESNGSLGVLYLVNTSVVGCDQSNFTDLRVTWEANSGGVTENRSFWVDTFEATKSAVFINMSNSTNGAHYVYCGNSTADSVQDGDKTFGLFDNFDDGSFDAVKWNRSVAGPSPTITESGGSLVLTTDNSGDTITIYNNLSAFRALKWNEKALMVFSMTAGAPSGGAGTGSGNYGFAVGGGDVKDYMQVRSLANNTRDRQLMGGDTTITDYVFRTKNLVQIFKEDLDVVRFFKNDTLEQSFTSNIENSSRLLRVRLSSGGETVTTTFDWMGFGLWSGANLSLSSDVVNKIQINLTDLSDGRALFWSSYNFSSQSFNNCEFRSHENNFTTTNVSSICTFTGINVSQSSVMSLTAGINTSGGVFFGGTSNNGVRTRTNAYYWNKSLNSSFSVQYFLREWNFTSNLSEDYVVNFSEDSVVDELQVNVTGAGSSFYNKTYSNNLLVSGGWVVNNSVLKVDFNASHNFSFWINNSLNLTMPEINLTVPRSFCEGESYLLNDTGVEPLSYDSGRIDMVLGGVVSGGVLNFTFVCNQTSLVLVGRSGASYVDLGGVLNYTFSETYVSDFNLSVGAETTFSTTTYLSGWQNRNGFDSVLNLSNGTVVPHTLSFDALNNEITVNWSGVVSDNYTFYLFYDVDDTGSGSPPSSPPNAGGGGGSSTLSVIPVIKDVCDVGFVPSRVFLNGSVLSVKVGVVNNDNATYSPELSFVNASIGGLAITNPVGTILPDSVGSFGVKYVPSLFDRRVEGSAVLVASSVLCSDVGLPVVVSYESSGLLGVVGDRSDYFGVVGDLLGLRLLSGVSFLSVGVVVLLGVLVSLFLGRGFVLRGLREKDVLGVLGFGSGLVLVGVLVGVIVSVVVFLIGGGIL